MRGNLIEPRADAGLHQGEPRLIPAFVPLRVARRLALEDQGLDRVERGKHPGDRAGARRRIFGQQAAMTRRDVEDDRARLEERDAIFLIGRNLPEGLERQMRGLLHRGE